jgi:hypothetical protein
MTNANVPASSRRRLHSSRKLAAGDKIGALSYPTLDNKNRFICPEHHGYSFPGNCEQLTYHTYTGQGCFDNDVEVPIDIAAHYNESECLALTNTWKNDTASKVWPIDDPNDRQHRAWTNEDTTPQKYQWKASAGTKPDIKWEMSGSKLLEISGSVSGLDVTAADRKRYRHPSNWELVELDEVAGWTPNQAAVEITECDNNGLDGVSKYGAVGGADSCYIGSNTYKPGCIFVPITPTDASNGTCVDCVKKNGGYHYTGGRSSMSAADAKCKKNTESAPCVRATSIEAGGTGCPDTSDCTECFAADKLEGQTGLNANWATAIGELEAIKDAVTENTKQCQKIDLGGDASCDQNNVGYFWQKIGPLRANTVNVVYPTRVDKTDYFKTEIIARAYTAFDAFTTSISNDLNTIAAYTNNKKHAHHENEAQTKIDIEAKINSLHAEGKTLQDNLKDSFKFLNDLKFERKS